MKKTRRQLPATRRGYVLLMVLLLLTVSTTAVGVICSAATGTQAEAARAQDDLQLRWGRISCQAALLPAADNIMDRARLMGAPASTVFWASITLNGQPIRLGFGDEEARLNLNNTYASEGKDGVRRLLQSLGRNGFLRPRLILGPEPTGQHMAAFILPFGQAPADTDSTPALASAAIPVIGSYGQFFPDASPAELASAIDLTCWGDGKINLHRASSPVIAQVAGHDLTPLQIRQIVALRDAQIDPPLQTMLAATGSADPDGTLASRFTDDSFCHSLWIITQVGQRAVYHLAVRDATDTQRVHSADFDW